MKFGLHVSAAGGVDNAPDNAKIFGCETFQFFTRSPRGGAAPKLTPTTVSAFKTKCAAAGFSRYYTHAPYFVNFASTDNRIYHGSISIVHEELERSSLLGVTALMTHIGSAKELDRTAAIKKVVDGVVKLLTGYKGSTQFLLEISAGTGNVIGDSFEEIAEIIKRAQPKVKSNIGVCFDTAHAFASGYDLRTPKAVTETFKKFDKIIGLSRLVLIHGNDSKVDINERRDRHWHIGHGKIGLAGFRVIINHPKLKKLDMILETPDDSDNGTWDKKNMATVKKLRG